MNMFCKVLVGTAIAVSLAGCGLSTMKPNYTSTNTDLLRIGGDKPEDKAPETINSGSYCLQIIDKWKADGKTPDGQTVWSKDSFRKATPCN